MSETADQEEAEALAGAQAELSSCSDIEAAEVVFEAVLAPIIAERNLDDRGVVSVFQVADTILSLMGRPAVGDQLRERLDKASRKATSR